MGARKLCLNLVFLRHKRRIITPDSGEEDEGRVCQMERDFNIRRMLHIKGRDRKGERGWRKREW